MPETQSGQSRFSHSSVRALASFKALAVTCLLTGLLAACSPSGTPQPPAGTLSASQGGVVSDPASGASLSVPAGGLSADSAVVVMPSSAALPTLEGQKLLAGSAVLVSGNGTAALSTGTLTLPFKAADVAALSVSSQASADSLRLYQLLNQVWQQVQGTPSINASTGLYSQVIAA